MLQTPQAHTIETPLGALPGTSTPLHGFASVLYEKPHSEAFGRLRRDVNSLAGLEEAGAGGILGGAHGWAVVNHFSV